MTTNGQSGQSIRAPNFANDQPWLRYKAIIAHVRHANMDSDPIWKSAVDTTHSNNNFLAAGIL
jgi:hypothetical protein